MFALTRFKRLVSKKSSQNLLILNGAYSSYVLIVHIVAMIRALI
eukprot:12241.XXX_99338_99469_1 [CDS] Oithona nana genome sequencing.